MDQILLGLGAAGAALLIIAIGVALWEHRRHTAEMRQQQAWSENTRDLLHAHAKDVDARLATLTAAVQSHLMAAPGEHTPPQRVSTSAAVAATAGPQPASVEGAARLRTTAHAGSAAVAMAAAQSAVTQQWIDTEPMVLTSQVLDFDPTMPAELSAH